MAGLRKTRFPDNQGSLPCWASGLVGKQLAFLWGTWRASSGYRPVGSRLSPSPTGVSQLPHQPIRCIGETNPLTQEDCLHYPCVIVVKRFISSSYYQNAFLGIANPLLPLSSKMLIPEFVSRTPYGKEAEGNGETPNLKAEVP